MGVNLGRKHATRCIHHGSVVAYCPVAGERPFIWLQTRGQLISFGRVASDAAR